MTFFSYLIRIKKNKNEQMFKNSSILITGGTGSFGHSFVSLTLKKI